MQLGMCFGVTAGISLDYLSTIHYWQSKPEGQQETDNSQASKLRADSG